MSVKFSIGWGAIVATGWLMTLGVGPAAAQVTLANAEARVADPFFTRRSFTFGRTLYVAINEPGASNNNDGRYPTYRGGTKGPLKDLTSIALRQALSNTSTGLRVYIRAGTYLPPDGGVRIRGLGNESTPVMVSGYPGDARPIIDGGECQSAEAIQAIAQGAPYTPRVESVVKLDGQYGIVQNLQLQCGFRYNVFARGQHLIVRRNVLRGSYEDSIKNTVGADYGLIADNDISGFVSQGLDHFGANHWLITRNVFHDPGPDALTGEVVGNAITVKGSAQNVVITRNRVQRFATALDQAAITLGAPASLESVRYDTDGQALPAAIDAVAMANVVEDFTGAGFGVQSCQNCVVAENIVDRTLGVMRIGISDETRAVAQDSAILPYSTGTTLRDNHGRFAVVDCSDPAWLGQSCYAVFVVNGLETAGMTLTGNTYYSGTMPAFVYDWSWYSLEEMQTLFGVEDSSQMAPVGAWPH